MQYSRMLSTQDRYPLSALLASSLVLKLLWTGTNALAHDEPFTVFWALQAWPDFLAMLRTENNPPLYFILMKAWAAVVPLEAAWLRIPSAIASSFVVLPLFLIGKRLGGTLAATAAALVFMLNGYHYGFAHEVRAYALFTLLTATAMWQLLRAANGRVRAMTWLLVTDMLLVYTHFFGWLVVGPQLLLILAIREFRPLLRKWCMMVVLLLLAYAPYAYIFLSRVKESVVQGTWLESPAVEEVYNMLWRWSNAPVLAVAFLALVIFTVFRDRFATPALKLASIWAFIPLVGMFILSYWVPVFLDRYLVFAAPGWALLIGLALARLPQPAAPLAVLVSALALAFTFKPHQRGLHYPERVVQQVEEFRTVAPCAPVLVVPPWYRLTYRFAQAPDRFASEPPELLHTYELEPGSQDCPVLILVDAAPPDDGSRELRSRLLYTHQAVDSVEASHKVWVIRFVRR